MESAQYPEGSGFSYSRFYLPDAFDTGWRLANMSKQLWAVFEMVTKAYRGSKPLEIPMQNLTQVIGHLLTTYIDCDPEISFTPETLSEAVILSGMDIREAIDAQASKYEWT